MSQLETLSAFVKGAPPGELADVVTDIKALTASSPRAVSDLSPAFKQYNEEQLVTVKLPGSSQQVLISSHNSLGGERYYDVESSSSFVVDHTAQTARDVQIHVLESTHSELIKSILKGLKTYVGDHFSNAAYGAYSIEVDAKIAVLIVANKYSPTNFWNGRWRSRYVYDPASGHLEGAIQVDVHYYEDGNVRLLTEKSISQPTSAETGSSLVKKISAFENSYQDELNRSFVALSDGAFKGLRRQLPVTRQKIEWDKMTSYRLGQDIGGGSAKR